MSNNRTREFSISSAIVGVGVDDVWARVESWTGVNAELAPLVKMTWPKEYAVVSEVPVTGETVFTSLILVLGIVPFDVHKFGLNEVQPGHFFDEISSNFMMRRWTHRRTVEATDDGVRVTDHCTFVPRFSFMSGLLMAAYQFVFRHRHRRLTRHYGRDFAGRAGG